MFTTEFWKRTAERAVKTGAQAVSATWFVGDVVANAFTLDLKLGAGLFLGGALASVLTSVASAPIGPAGDPSIVT